VRARARARAALHYCDTDKKPRLNVTSSQERTPSFCICVQSLGKSGTFYNERTHPVARMVRTQIMWQQPYFGIHSLVAYFCVNCFRPRLVMGLMCHKKYFILINILIGYFVGRLNQGGNENRVGHEERGTRDLKTK